MLNQATQESAETKRLRSLLQSIKREKNQRDAMLCAELSKCIVHWLEMHLEWQILFFSGTPRKMVTTPKDKTKRKNEIIEKRTASESKETGRKVSALLIGRDRFRSWNNAVMCDGHASFNLAKRGYRHECKVERSKGR